MRCNSIRNLTSSINNFIHQHQAGQTLLNASNQQGLVCAQLSRHFHSVHQESNLHSWLILQNVYQKQLKSANKKYACFLLNIDEHSFKHFERYRYIWNEASLKVAVDGSANILAQKKMIHTADVVCGDFDSVNADLIEQLRCPTKAIKLYLPKEYHHHHPPPPSPPPPPPPPHLHHPLPHHPPPPHQHHHSQQSPSGESSKPPLPPMPHVVETPGQKETDFTKALRVAIGLRPDIHFFFGLYNNSDGSRIDHLFGLVNTLHLVKRNIILVNIQSNTISWLLQAGKHAIHKPRGRELCSLVPFNGPAEVSTEGLEYDMGPNGVTLNFGGLISTSNICKEDCESIMINTNRELLWSIEACA